MRWRQVELEPCHVLDKLENVELKGVTVAVPLRDSLTTVLEVFQQVLVRKDVRREVRQKEFLVLKVRRKLDRVVRYMIWMQGMMACPGRKGAVGTHRDGSEVGVEAEGVPMATFKDSVVGSKLLNDAGTGRSRVGEVVAVVAIPSRIVASRKRRRTFGRKAHVGKARRGQGSGGEARTLHDRDGLSAVRMKNGDVGRRSVDGFVRGHILG
jgi:hypothetical protein